MVEISPTLRIEEGRHSSSSSSSSEEEKGESEEVEEQHFLRGQSSPPRGAEYSQHNCSREQLEQRRSWDAQRRWKILCIVRTADVESDETARQEKIQERVDEWMSGFMAKMRIQSEEEQVNI